MNKTPKLFCKIMIPAYSEQCFLQLAYLTFALSKVQLFNKVYSARQPRHLIL